MRRYIRIISVVFLCSTLALAYFGYLLLDRFNQSVKYTDEINHTYELINKMVELESFAKDAETAQRGFLITNDSAYLAPLFDIRHKIYPLADSLLQSVQDKKQKERLIMLKLSVAALMNYVNFNLESPRANIKAFLKKDMDDGKHLMDRLRKEIAEIKNVELQLLKTRNNTKTNYLKSTSVAFITALLVLAIIVITSFILLIRELRKRFKTELQLQTKIVQLQQFTKESEELSYAISHDLQEPLRKMRIFTDRLFHKHKAALDNEGKEIVQRMNVVAATAQETMNELLRFTSVIPQIEQKKAVDLNKLIPSIWGKMAEKTIQKNAVINLEPLPIIKGSEERLSILFENLLNNALLFSKDGMSPLIKIKTYKTTGQKIAQAASYQRRKTYDAIEISDNGIGFDNGYANKIFQLFRRLHVGQEKYAGKGIGLAICQRIMSNHHGFISAKGKVGEGAVFTVYFPAEG
jgi:signal transduction histidine kinase